MKESIYACLFSTGLIKVGRSIDPVSRMAAHAERLSCAGIELVETHFAFVRGCVVASEQELIRRCNESSSKKYKAEWFDGLDFKNVVGWIDEISSTEIKPRIFDIAKPYEAIGVVFVGPPYTRYICVEPCSPSNGWVAKWADKEPDKPHWPGSAVMRWDLRPGDWWKVWPECISHPCATLFAPTHPDREGAPKLIDWVASWVTKPNAKEIAESLPPNISAECMKRGRDLRPDDWHLIWPELVTEEFPAPERLPTREAA